MKPLESPFRSGRIRRRWYHRLPFFSPGGEYVKALKQQLADRGEVPADVWGGQSRQDIALRIEELLAEHCWGERLSFHPDDPWMVVGDWEVGDLCEAEALMAIEEEFGVQMPAGGELAGLLAAGWTFGDLVSRVEAGAAPARERR